MSQDVSTFSDEGWKRSSDNPVEPVQVAGKVAGPIEVDVGPLKIKVGPRAINGQTVAQGDVSITVDGNPVQHVQRIVLTGDARTGWSVNLTLYPLLAK